MSATRPWVNAFADEMESKLSANRHKGDREGWAKESPRWLLGRLEAEVIELRRALMLSCDRCGHRDMPTEMHPFDCLTVIRECADVANFAMMIADVAGGMEPKS